MKMTAASRRAVRAREEGVAEVTINDIAMASTVSATHGPLWPPGRPVKKYDFFLMIAARDCRYY